MVTNLFDEKLFPAEEFQAIYHLRWGIEGFFALLKTRLNLENFSGKTVESIYQDFYSTIYLTGLETILTEGTNDKLKEKDTLYRQQVNHIVSFNAIKNQALDILWSDISEEDVIKGLEILFRTNPVLLRPERIVPRTKDRSQRKELTFLKRKKKICF